MKTGDANARSFIAGHSYQLDVIGGVLIQTRQSDGLTWAKPDYQSKYLMDNCEAYRGLRDLASLFQNAFGDSAKAAYYNNAANSMQSGILGMWLNGTWAVYKNDIGGLAAPNMRTWYADASAQVFTGPDGRRQLIRPSRSAILCGFQCGVARLVFAFVQLSGPIPMVSDRNRCGRDGR
jgi:hypothetical protein